MPRDRAMMPYWVPQVLRSHNKVRGRLAQQQGLRVRGGFPREQEKRRAGAGFFLQRLPLLSCRGGVL